MKKKRLALGVGVFGVAAFVLSLMCGSYTFGDPVSKLQEELGQDFAYVKEVRVHNLGELSWSTYDTFDVKTTWHLEGETTDDKLRSLFDGMLRYSYAEDQNDPMLLDELGYGNCQALTLYAKELLDEAGIANCVKMEPNHMYNIITKDKEVYSVDFAKGILKKEVKADE